MNENENLHWSKFRGKPVVVKFGHLNPALREIIIFRGLANSIKGTRYVKTIGEAGLLMGLINLRRIENLSVGLAISALGGTARLMAARDVQKLHLELADSIKNHGILQTIFEGSYPKDWINPTIVSQTHPIFYVKGNGDLVFLPNSRTEYYRFRFQESKLGKLGLNAWRWRAYLKLPEAPEKVRAWAAEKIKKLVKAYSATAKPAPVPVQVKAAAARKRFGRRWK